MPKHIEHEMSEDDKKVVAAIRAGSRRSWHDVVDCYSWDKK
jgi:hypothetical protein